MHARLFRSILCIAAATIAELSSAAPITLNFKAHVYLQHDYVTNELTNPNLDITGSVLIDSTSLPPNLVRHEPEFEARLWEAGSGCMITHNGTCSPGFDYGSSAPLILGYSLNLPNGIVSQTDLMQSPQWATISHLYKNQETTSPKQLYLLNYLAAIAELDDSGQISRSDQQYLGIGFSAEDGGLFNDIENPNEAINFSAPWRGDGNFYYSLDHCQGGAACQSAPGSYGLSFTITEVSIARAPGEVPEPTSLSILGLGLAGLVYARRRGNLAHEKR